MSVITYETVFIAEPEISNDQVDQLINKIKGIITANQGTLTGEDRWGRRRMAYAIHGHREGYYAVLSFSAEPGVVNAIEHLYNVTDSVIRHLTTKVIKSKKTFRPRKEKPAGHVEGSRYAGRPTTGYRPRSDAPAAAKPAVAEAAPAARRSRRRSSRSRRRNSRMTPTTTAAPTQLRLLQLNDVRLVGRLTRDPEVRYTPKGQAVARLDMAVNRRFKDGTGEWRDDTTFVPVTVWREAAERCRERLKKGSPIYVEGRLRSTNWETKDGQKRSGMEVEAYRLQFLAKTSGEEASGGFVFGETEASR